MKRRRYFSMTRFGIQNACDKLRSDERLGEDARYRQEGWCRMKRFVFIVTFLVASPVVAEVCDKQRPEWNPADGPISQFGEFGYFIGTPFGVFLGILSLTALLLRARWLSVTAAVLLLLAVGLHIVEWFGPFDIKIVESAFREGCQNSPLLTIVALVMMIVVLVRFDLSKRDSAEPSDQHR